MYKPCYFTLNWLKAPQFISRIMGPKCGISCYPSGTENLEEAPGYLKHVEPCLQRAVIVVSAT